MCRKPAELYDARKSEGTTSSEHGPLCCERFEVTGEESL